MEKVLYIHLLAVDAVVDIGCDHVGDFDLEKVHIRGFSKSKLYN